VEPFASRLTEADRRFLARNSRFETYTAGQRVIRKDDVSDAMFVIREGSCVVRLPDGQSRDLAVGDYFGEIGLLSEGRRTADVVAGDGGVQVLRLGRVAIRSLLNRNNDLREALGQKMTQRLDEIRSLLEAEEAPSPLTWSKAVAGVAHLLRPW
jgi:CPA2 family monovalent cation:H+ antiporter-2